MFFNGQIRTVLIISLQLTIFGISKNVEAEEVKYGYTEQELKLIPKFRMLFEADVIKEYMLHDSYLVRWIRCSNYDLELARVKFIEHVQWKKELDESDYLSDAKELDKLMPYEIVQAKDGRPALIKKFGHWNVWKAESTSKQPYPFTRHIMKIYEEIILRIIEVSYQGHPNVTNAIEIFDLVGYDLGSQGCASCISDYLNAASLLESQYPRLMGDIVGINNPWIIESVLNLVRSVLGDYYNQIMKLYGSNKADWEGPVINLLGYNPFSQFGGKGIGKCHQSEIMETRLNYFWGKSTRIERRRLSIQKHLE